MGFLQREGDWDGLKEDRLRRAMLGHEGNHKDPQHKGKGMGTYKRAESRAAKYRGEEEAKPEASERVLEGRVGCGL